MKGGAVCHAWRVSTDLINSASATQQAVVSGTAPAPMDVDGPLPAWRRARLGVMLLAMARRRRRALAGVTKPSDGRSPRDT